MQDLQVWICKSVPLSYIWARCCEDTDAQIPSPALPSSSQSTMQFPSLTLPWKQSCLPSKPHCFELKHGWGRGCWYNGERRNCMVPAHCWSNGSPGHGTSQPPSHLRCWNSSRTMFISQEIYSFRAEKIDFRLILGAQTRESAACTLADHISLASSYIPPCSYTGTACPDMHWLNQSCTGSPTATPGNPTPLNTLILCWQSLAEQQHPRLKSVDTAPGCCSPISAPFIPQWAPAVMNAGAQTAMGSDQGKPITLP